MHNCVVLAVTESSQVGEARRAVTALASQLGFNETESGKVALVVTELANNLVKHAREGVLLFRPLEQQQTLGIEILTMDKGPGMADVGRCLSDGFSTAGSPGTGLGAIVRLCTFTDIHSIPQVGTALVARLWAGATPAPSANRLQTSGVSVPKSGESACGDAWAVEQGSERCLVLVADGLGHGPLAAEAAHAAIRIFLDNAHAGPVAFLQAAHLALRSTRGAAVAIAEVDLDREVVLFAGVGNIAGAVLAGEVSRSMVSHNGTIGGESRKFQEFSYPFPRGALLIMHSDGLASRWSLAPYPGLALRDPALIAGVLYRDFQRGRDDVTVVVAREEGRNNP